MQQLLGEILRKDTRGRGLLGPQSGRRQNTVHVKHGALKHLAIRSVTGSNRVRDSVVALETASEALLRTSDEAVLSNTSDVNIEGGLATCGAEVSTLVAALAVEVVRPLSAGLALISAEASACSVETHTVSVTGSLADRFGAVWAVPSLEAGTLSLTKRVLV